MSDLSRQKILRKLENFNEYLDYLRQLQKEAATKRIFLSDFHIFGNTERYLHLCIQIIIDVSHLIIIDLDLKRPEDNYEAIAILFEEGVVSEGLAQKLTKMIGLRNILVHEYGDIDREKVYQILKNQTKDLEQFKKQVMKRTGL